MSRAISKKEILERFGKIFIEFVRDRTISINNKIMEGVMNAASDKELYNLFCQLDKNQQEVVRKFIFNALDQTIHHFLWMIEENDEIDLVYRDLDNPEKVVSLKDISDGLCGEVHTEEGWIERFSKYSSSVNF